MTLNKMLINILFALIALGAMCIDIVLNRGLLDEINDEAKEHKKELGELLYRKGVSRIVKERLKDILDTVDTLTEKLRLKVQKGCASKNARPFYIVIIVASITVVISALVDYFHGVYHFYNWHFFPSLLYKILVAAGDVIWFSILFYLLRKLYLLYDFNKIIENERNKIDKIVKDAKYSINFFLSK